METEGIGRVEAPVIPEGQTCVNGIGWEVQVFAAKGWWRTSRIFKEKSEAEKALSLLRARLPCEFRVYESLKEQ